MSTRATIDDQNLNPSSVSLRERAWHVVSLCAFAFTEPILAALARQTVYLHDQEITWAELSIGLIVICVLLPAACVLLDAAVQRRKGRGRNAVLFVLGTLVMLSLLRPCARIEYVRQHLSPWLLSLLVSLIGGWLVTRLYDRLAGLRFWLSVSSLGILIFPLAFVWQIEVDRRLRLNDEAQRTSFIDNPIPVVVVVFDEISATSLMDEQLQIDSKSFPNFARLASQSTWYRRATTVHPRTDFAVPAILSGQFPDEAVGPVEENFPGNLLQSIYNSHAYDMAVFEPVTRLCPGALRREKTELPDSMVLRTVNLLHTLSVVYPRLILPGDTPLNFPEIPKGWFGMRPKPLSSLTHLKTGLFHYRFTDMRPEQLRHFLGCLTPSDRPLFAFFHVLLPHIPWEFLPSGRSCFEPDHAIQSSVFSGMGELGEDWPDDAATVARNEHRYLLQFGYTDRFVGQLLDRLKESGLLDRCLLVVTGDHGVSFRPGSSRRVPDAENITDIMSVPLFIKMPNQTVGSIDDRNVESIDVFPTIAEILKMPLAVQVDGSPVSSEPRRPRKSLYFEKQMTAIEPSLPQLEAVVRRRRQIFCEDSQFKLPRSMTSRPDWIGRPAKEVATIEPKAAENGPSVMLSSLMRKTSFNNVAPLLIEGAVNTSGGGDSDLEVVLCVNGIVIDAYVTRAVTQNRFSFLVVEPDEEINQDSIELFLVSHGDLPKPVLIPLEH